MSKIKREIVEELHKSARVNFPRRRVIVRGLDELFQADLVEMLPYAKLNRGFRYILVVIDVFSKFVWTAALKNKTAQSVTKAIKDIFITDKRIPKNLQTDAGKEFFNKDFENLMKKYNINHYSTFSSKKASVVERVNRTLKSMMWRDFSMQGSYKWISLLPKITHKYNSTIHSTIKMKPADVNAKNEKQLLNTVYSFIKLSSPVKFKVGEFVRISKHRNAFVKGYTPNWSNEIFTINQIKYTNPTTYILKDHSDQIIRGGFYEHELQKAKYPNVYLVEKVLKRKGDQVYVKWLGFSSLHNTWIPKKNIE